MAQTRFAYAGEMRDPKTAAMLSMVPGLGQFYNGESRKGFLFLDVAIINVLLIGIILFAPGIATLMQNFGHQFGMRVNHGVLDALSQMHFGSPVSLVMGSMVLAFVGFSVRDAYDHALIRRRKALYKDSVIELNEASSGSYIIHASIIVALAIMALFFFIPKPPARQITEFEFFTSVPVPKIDSTKIIPLKSSTSTHETTRHFDATRAVQKLLPKAELSKQTSETKTSSHTEHSDASKSAAQFKPVITPVKPSSSSSSSAAIAHPLKQVLPPQMHTAARPNLLAQSIPAPTMMPKLPTMASSATNADIMPRPIATPITAPKMPATPTAMPKNRAVSASSMTPTLLAMASPTSLPTMPAAAAPGTSSAIPTPSISQLAAGGFTHSGSSHAMPTSSTAPSGSLQNAVQLPTAGGIPLMGGSGQKYSPPASTSSAKSGGPAAGAPGAVSIPTHSAVGGPGGDGPVPEAMTKGHGPGSKGIGDLGTDSVPTPNRAGRNGTHGDGPIRIVPSSGPTAAQSGPGTERPNHTGDPSNSDSSGSTAAPDFSKYMEDLQRRIKRSWFPPKTDLSKKIKVMFKVHTNGELSNARITLGSGSPNADQAALSAIEGAAPFQHLPAHAPESVDIEFTFDYNVYASR